MLVIGLIILGSVLLCMTEIAKGAHATCIRQVHRELS